jgi:cyclase
MKALLLSLLLAATGPGLLAQEPDYSQYQLKTTKLAESLYLIQDAGEPLGGNILVLAGDDGLVMVDDQLPQMSDKVLAALKTISDRPVRVVFNTHHHRDHSGGNERFIKAALIMANENVVASLRKHGRGTVPNVLFSGNMELRLNGETIRAVHYPAAHTSGDLAVFFENAKVVHLGDMYFAGYLPFIDLEAGGSVDGLLSALSQVIANAPRDLKVVPGHGRVSNLNDLKDYVAMLRDSAAIVDAGIAHGKTLQQMQSEKVLGKYQELEWKYGSLNDFTEIIYKDCLKAKKSRE